MESFKETFTSSSYDKILTNLSSLNDLSLASVSNDLRSSGDIEDYFLLNNLMTVCFSESIE